MGSLRARLTLALAAVTVTVIAVSAVVSIILIFRFLEQRDIERLQATTTAVDSAFTASGGAVLDERALRYSAWSGAETILVADKGVLRTGDNVSDVTAAALASVLPGDPVDLDGRYLAAAVDTENDGLRYRAADGTETTITRIVVFIDSQERRASVVPLVVAVSAASAGAIAILVLVAVAIVARGLAPLRVMAERAARIADGDRTVRLPVENSGDPAIEQLGRTVNAAFDAQQDAEQRMRSFIADASHELRSPLTTAKGWIELYLNGGLNDRDERDSAMQRVETQLSRMRVLIDELALLARSDDGRPVAMESVDVSEVARDIVGDARVIAPKRPLSVQGQAALVLGDRAQLEQVVRNLVGNALQHTPPEATITVSVTPGTRRHTLVVTDTGPGVRSEHLPHLFERFWRGDPSRTNTSGSGLGLAIVQAIVTAHGGTIDVASEAGAGTTFTVTLPAFTPAASERAR